MVLYRFITMATAGPREESRKVIDLSAARRRKTPFGNSAPVAERGKDSEVASLKQTGGGSKGNGNSEKEKPVNSTTCTYLLNGVSPLPEDLPRLLEMPETLYMSPDTTSFTSESGKHAFLAAQAIAYGESLPRDLPDYAICTFNKNSALFCLLVDKRRKIIVFNSISNIYSGTGGSWTGFEESLRDAVAFSRKLQQSGDDFAFVVMEGRLASKIPSS